MGFVEEEGGFGEAAGGEAVPGGEDFGIAGGWSAFIALCEEGGAGGVELGVKGGVIVGPEGKGEGFVKVAWLGDGVGIDKKFSSIGGKGRVNLVLGPEVEGAFALGGIGVEGASEEFIGEEHVLEEPGGGLADDG